MQTRKELRFHTFHVDDADTWLYLFRVLYLIHYFVHLFEVQKDEQLKLTKTWHSIDYAIHLKS
jgi:hypothetical protein